MNTTGEQTGPDRDNAELMSTVEQLRAAVRKLPECSDAAKLRGIAHRLATGAQDGSEPLSPLTRRLAIAARDAVEGDPWVAVDRLARRLLEICEPTSVDNVPITTSTCATARKRMSERHRNPNQEQLRKHRAEQEELWNAQRTESSVADAESRD